jgi:hypothetical protein
MWTSLSMALCKKLCNGSVWLKVMLSDLPSVVVSHVLFNKSLTKSLRNTRRNPIVTLCKVRFETGNMAKNQDGILK